MYHYKGASLRNVWLTNGYEVRKTAYGKAVSIQDVEGLHRALALLLITTKPRLSGGEFRFLRKELDMSQAKLGEWMGVEAQTVALWEKTGRVPKGGDRFIRAIYREIAEGNAHIVDLVNRLNEMDRLTHEKKEQRLVFEETSEGWKAAA